MTTKRSNLSASIHQRLLNIARREDRTLNELLQHFAIERFLFRLGQTEYRTKFILKGAQMLRIWEVPAARPTMDVDLLGRTNNDIGSLQKIMRECCSIEVDDGVVFDPESVAAEIIRKAAEYQGVRVTASGLLGKIRLHLQIDIGFGDAVVPGPIEIVFPQLLDLGQPILLGYTPESAIAEKFHAMVVLDMVNTRMKDFYDIWLLLTTINFDKAVLTEALRRTFKHRATPLPDEIPVALTDTFTDDSTKKAQWQAFLRKNRLDTGLELRTAASVIGKKLMPLIAEKVDRLSTEV
jgi:hypothetical protein